MWCLEVPQIRPEPGVLLWFQARAVLEREFNNLLVLGTDRRFNEVSSQPSALGARTPRLSLCGPPHTPTPTP